MCLLGECLLPHQVVTILPRCLVFLQWIFELRVNQFPHQNAAPNSDLVVLCYRSGQHMGQPVSKRFQYSSQMKRPVQCRRHDNHVSSDVVCRKQVVAHNVDELQSSHNEHGVLYIDQSSRPSNVEVTYGSNVNLSQVSRNSSLALPQVVWQT